MLVAAAILIILVLLGLILSKKLSALTALILVPVTGALIAGFGLQTAEFALKGVISVAPVAAMFIFAILFFGILTDAGMFDPLIDRILRIVGTDPVKITIGTAVLAMLVHLDGSGAVTFLIVIPAMLPLFERLEMDKRVLAAVTALGAGTMNIVPWGGPTLRAASALNIEVTDLYRPVMTPQIFGLLFVIGVAWYLGSKEAKRLGSSISATTNENVSRTLSSEELQTRRHGRFWINMILTGLTIVFLISGLAAPVLVFMLGCCLALLINYPSISEQRQRIDAHAKAALMMAGILFAAGVFTGIMKESGMISALASEAVNIIPAGSGKHLPFLISVLSMPMSLLFDPDSFYFGFMPVVAEVASETGASPAMIGQAAILGQMTTGFPYSPLTPTTFLLLGLCNLELADHQRFSMKYAFLTTLVMSLMSVVFGIFPI